MNFEIQELSTEEFPYLLNEIPDKPTKLYASGNIKLLSDPVTKFLTVVGSRKYSAYGKQVCEQLISDLSGYPIVIVSGLALGMDAIAHRAALAAKLPTIVVPGSGLSEKILYPRSHINLAREVLANNGALLSEFEADFKATRWSFAKRNRIMAGMSHATLLIEAEERSGTLITARLATDYDRELLVVPHDITRPSSKGVHQFLKLGATPITCANDILKVLNIEEKTLGAPAARQELSDNEKIVYQILKNSAITRAELIEKMNMNITDANILLSSMELKGLIKEELGKIRFL